MKMNVPQNMYQVVIRMHWKNLVKVVKPNLPEARDAGLCHKKSVGKCLFLTVDK